MCKQAFSDPCSVVVSRMFYVSPLLGQMKIWSILISAARMFFLPQSLHEGIFTSVADVSFSKLILYQRQMSWRGSVGGLQFFTFLHGMHSFIWGFLFLYILARSMESKWLFLCLGVGLGSDPCEVRLRSVWDGLSVFPLNSLYMFINQSWGKIWFLTDRVSFNWNVGWLSYLSTGIAEYER